MGLFSIINAAVLPEPPGSCPHLSTVTLHLVRTVCNPYDLQFSIFFKLMYLANNPGLYGTHLPFASMAHVHKETDSTVLGCSRDTHPNPHLTCERHAAGQYRKIQNSLRERGAVCLHVHSVAAGGAGEVREL